VFVCMCVCVCCVFLYFTLGVLSLMFAQCCMGGRKHVPDGEQRLVYGWRRELTMMHVNILSCKLADLVR